MSNLTNSPEWLTLKKHQKRIDQLDIRDLFEANPNRFHNYSIQFEDLLFDYSKNRITDETIVLLLNLAKSQNLLYKKCEIFVLVFTQANGKAIQAKKLPTLSISV